MSTAKHYRDQAANCRTLAEREPNSRHAARWLALAQNYELIAQALQQRLNQRAREWNAKAARAPLRAPSELS
jgi:hypothetical protein